MLKQTFKIKYQENSSMKELIVTSDDLRKEKLPNNILFIKNIDNKNISLLSNSKINEKDIRAIFYELNLMLQSNIVMSEALDILIKNRKDEKIKSFLLEIKNSFTNTRPLSDIFHKYKLNDMVVSFLSLCQSTGNIKLNIKALNTLLKESYEIKNDFKKVMRYPMVLIVSFFISLNLIFYFVIPKFKVIFESNIENLPLATKILFNTHYFYINYCIYLMIFLFLLCILTIVLYQKNHVFKYKIHKLLVKNIHIFKDIYLNMQLYKLFLVLDIMLKSNYEFHKALISSKVLLNNKYLLDRILLIENLLENGKSINYSFAKTKLFDDLVLNLINTAEVSNSLNIITEEIKTIYKNRFNEKIKLLTTIIEPIFLITLMSLILWIVLAVFMPIWDMGNIMKN